MLSDPVLLFSPDGRRSKRFAAVDAAGWIRAGWSLVPIEKVVAKELVADPLSGDSTGTINPELETSTIQLDVPLTAPQPKPEGKKK